MKFTKRHFSKASEPELESSRSLETGHFQKYFVVSITPFVYTKLFSNLTRKNFGSCWYKHSYKVMVTLTYASIVEVMEMIIKILVEFQCHMLLEAQN